MLSKSLEKQLEKNLALALLDFKNEKDLIIFLKDFLTPKELSLLTKRLSVLYWLSKNRNSKNITTNLKVSPIIISDAKSRLKKPSIKKAINKIDADIWSENWSKKIKGLIKSP